MSPFLKRVKNPLRKFQELLYSHVTPLQVMWQLVWNIYLRQTKINTVCKKFKHKQKLTRLDNLNKFLRKILR